MSRPVVLASALGLLTVAGTVLTGWAGGWDAATRLGMASVAVNPLTAVGFGVLAAGLGAVWAGRSPLPFGLLAIAFGAARLVAIAGGPDLGLDTWLFADRLAAATGVPNRMAPNTAMAFMLSGMALSALAFPGPGALRVRDVGAFGASQIALLALVGYAFQAAAFMRVASYIPLALPTAIGFAIAGVGLFAARTDGGPLAVLVSPGQGGRLLRQAGPLVVLAPLALAWLHLHGEARGLYDTTFGAALMALTTIWLGGFVVYRLALAIDAREALQAARTAELGAALAAAEAAGRAKDAFLATMSHELRTPLNAILGYAEILEEEAADEGRAHAEADLARIRGAGRNLLGLIDDVLALTALQAELVVAREAIDLAALLAASLEAVRPQAARARLALALDVPAGLPAVTTDPARLRQALGHLLGNACKFTPEGRVTLAARVERDDLVISVADTGIGMTPEQAARAFEPFTQGESGHSRGYGGSGLGLPLTRLLAGALGGDVRCTATAPGQGATFVLRIPLA